MTVANLGQAGAPGTVQADGSVKGGGIGYMIDVVLSRDAVTPPGFAPLPQPAGVAYQEDGLLQSGRVSRTPDVAAGSSVSLPSGPPVSTDVGGVVPTQTPPGDYFLCARIDPGGAVAESDEDNNASCLAVKVVP